MIEIRAEKAESRDHWRALLRRLGGTPLHLPEVHYGDYAPENLRTLYFGPAGAECAAASAFLIGGGWRRWLGRRPELHLPTAPAGIAGGGAERAAVYEALCDAGRRWGCRRLWIGAGWGDCHDDLPAFRPAIRARTREFVIDLTGGAEAVTAAMHKNHRKNIRRARQRELRIVRAEGLAGLEALRILQGVAAERAAARGAGFRVRSREYFRRVAGHVYDAGLGEILLAYTEDRCVAALAYIQFGTRAATVRSGCSREGYGLYAMYGLHAELLERTRAQGVTMLNFGGVPDEATDAEHPQHGLYEFKRGFGGRELLSTALRVELR
jgi:lipid II:glycine glycyltransferase (peptidoglycan interpeptide bridge formation enzyme)